MVSTLLQSCLSTTVYTIDNKDGNKMFKAGVFISFLNNSMIHGTLTKVIMIFPIVLSNCYLKSVSKSCRSTSFNTVLFFENTQSRNLIQIKYYV